MTAALNIPRFETKVTLSGFEFSVDIGGGGLLVTVADQEIWPKDLVPLLETRIEAVTGAGFAVSYDKADTGRLTVTRDVGNFQLFFDTSQQQALFGFTGDMTPAGHSFTGAVGMLPVWIPKCPMAGPDLDLELKGIERTDGAQLVGPTGGVSTSISNSFFSFRDVKLEMVKRDRALRGIGIPNGWQNYVRKTQLGGEGIYFPIVGQVAPDVRVFNDATSDQLLGTADSGDGVYQLVLNMTDGLGAAKWREDYSGYWTISIPELRKV